VDIGIDVTEEDIHGGIKLRLLEKTKFWRSLVKNRNKSAEGLHEKGGEVRALTGGLLWGVFSGNQSRNVGGTKGIRLFKKIDNETTYVGSGKLEG